MGMEGAAAVLLAGAALYALGLPVALLLPAPPEAKARFRVASAPLYAIVVAGVGAPLLTSVGLPLRWPSLVGIAIALWAAAIWVGRRRAGASSWLHPSGGWRVAIAQAGPALALVTIGLLLWAASLMRDGLVLPNRDFKNHAVYVATIAAEATVDPRAVLRPGPLADPVDSDFYPLGLHALLAWALPDPTSSTVAITAAAAVLVAAISMPLAVSVLASMWVPGDRRLAWLAGVSAVALPGATAAPFAIGSVTTIAAIALYAAGLAAVWHWARQPTLGTSLLLSMHVLGLFLLHVAEAIGLLLVALGTPLLRDARLRSALRWRHAALVGAVALVAAVVLWDQLSLLLQLAGRDWDLQANDRGPVSALLNALGQQPGSSLVALAWWLVALAGLVVARQRRRSGLPALALAVPVLLGTLATLRGAPALLELATVPWYGTATRAMALAFPVLVLAGCSGAMALVAGARLPALRWAIAATAAAILLVLAAPLVPERRVDLAASLAGAGDTARIAGVLATELRDGGSVLNLEPDGTAMLYAHARAPVTSAHRQDLLEQGSPPLSGSLLRLGDPEVAAQLAALDVRFLAIGTVSRYWGQGAGATWQDIAAQEQVEPFLTGTDMVVLRYLPGGRR